MNRIAFLLIILLTSQLIFGQTKREPQILILSPGKVTYDKSFEKEIQEINKAIKENSNYEEQLKELDSKESKSQPENILQMMRSEAEFSKNMDFYKTISYGSEQFLAYRFFEKFPNLSILLSDRKSGGELQELKRLSEQSKLQYILNFPAVSFYKENDISFAKIRVQLYDNNTNSILIDSSYTGDWNNPGFEFACQDSSIYCTVNNAISQALDDVIYNIASNSPTLARERQLSKERLEIIRSTYLNKPFDKTFVSNVVSKNGHNIKPENMYQTLFNKDRTKFVAFFIEKVTKQNFKELSENQQDKNVNIINNKDIRDTGYFDNIPQSYAYIVKAVQYKNKWYYEKANVTFFEPEDGEEGRLQYLNNLQNWNFFSENSVAENDDFWETSLFQKVKDLRQDPDWEKYGTTIWKTEEEENRNYIGLYEIVADQLKDKKTNEPKRIKMN